VSNDDLGGLAPLGNNPLDGDLLGDMPLPEASPLAGTSPLAASSTLLDEEAVGSPAGLVAGAAITPEAVADEPKEPKQKGPGFFSKLAQSNPYTVMLFAALVALLIGAVCLFLEWQSYHFDIKAKEARQSAQIAVPAEPTATTVNLLGPVRA